MKWIKEALMISLAVLIALPTILLVLLLIVFYLVIAAIAEIVLAMEDLLIDLLLKFRGTSREIESVRSSIFMDVLRRKGPSTKLDIIFGVEEMFPEAQIDLFMVDHNLGWLVEKGYLSTREYPVGYGDLTKTIYHIQRGDWMVKPRKKERKVPNAGRVFQPN